MVFISENAVFGIMLASTAAMVVSTGYLIHHLRLSFQSTFISPNTTPTDSVKPTPSETKNDDSSAPTDEKPSDSEDDGKPLIDDAYKRIHQRYNRKDYKWEDFDPLTDLKTHKGVVFIVYHRHSETNGVRQFETLVEVHSETLKDVLRGCLKHIDAVLDPLPLIDAQKLFNHETVLKAELERLQGELKEAEEKESTDKKDVPETEGEGTLVNGTSEPAASNDTQKDDSIPEPETPVVNGELIKVLVVNGDTSLDNDSTAVNTPGMSTPLPHDSADPAPSKDEDVPLTPDVLRLQALHLSKLLNFLETEYSPVRQKLNELLVHNDIKFNLLWCLFRLGSVITFKDHESGIVMAGEITSADYMRRGDHQEYFEIHVRYIDFNGSCFYYAWQRLEIPYFKELRKIRLLSAQPLDDTSDLKKQLTSRGESFVQLKGRHYLEYHDALYQRRNFGLESRILKFTAIGRAMVDCSSYQKMNPMSYMPDPDDEDKIDEVLPEELHYCAPTVFGYSFVTKMWGRLLADKFSPIVWNVSAFEHLVLPQETKTLIKSLVDADRGKTDIIKDVITGKGGGCIVILHGRPGTGKTLTAEAIAEERQKPLMVISVGELGKDASELEAKLTDILEISKLWEAVLLLDEADVFLEARSLHELHRNAMVGVFLRLLEYHQRVMFLTTNRVTTLDEAFKSRISIAIKYRDLDKDARRQVWENFLGLAGVKIVANSWVQTNGVDGEEKQIAVITKDEVNKLAGKKLNGREIKNTTRTAQALAVSLKRPLGYDLFKQVLDVGEQFDKDFKEVDTQGMYAAKGEALQDHHALYQ